MNAISHDEAGITIHRSELIPGGYGARIGYSDDFPNRVFLVVPVVAGAAPTSTLWSQGLGRDTEDRARWRDEIAEAKRTMTPEAFVDWLHRKMNVAG